jgi:thiamine biosynthesis lipoprotein
MKSAATIMGMPAVIEIADPAAQEDVEAIFSFLRQIDGRFSTYQESSEISAINEGSIAPADYSPDMKTILALAEQTKQETGGYFDIQRGTMLDPSGIVKGWAIWQAALRLQQAGMRNFSVSLGSDIQVCGHKAGWPWRIGIRNPFAPETIVKTLALTDCGVATSGTYERGQHIYNPHQPHTPITDIVSLTVIGPNILEADRFATAAFAMGKAGIGFIEQQPGLEGYMITGSGQAIYTAGLETYIAAL